VRHAAVPRYFAVKEAALAAGALGAGLSGSGPAVFALCADAATARRAGDAMAEAFRPAGIDAAVRISAVGAAGGRVLAAGETPCAS
jgi:homoserine kinase